MLSKILKNNLTEGVTQAFDLIYGDHDIAYKFHGYGRTKYTLGAADAFIFPFLASEIVRFTLPMKLCACSSTSYCVDETSIRNIFSPIGECFGPVLEAGRLLFACALTGATVPLIGATHAIKYHYVKSLENKINKLQGEMVSANCFSEKRSKTTLGEFIALTHSSLNALEVDQKDQNIIRNYHEFSPNIYPKLFFKISENNDPEILKEANDALVTLGLR